MNNFIIKYIRDELKIIQRKHLAIFSLALLLYAVLIFAMSGASNVVFEDMHLMLDTSNGLLSFMLAIFILSEQSSLDATVRKYLAICFGFTAVAEILHALVGVEWIGGFAWIGIYSHFLRPATWLPSTYLLPLSMLWILWLMRQRHPILRPGGFALFAFFIWVVLFVPALTIPPYIDSGFLGIQRPTQLPLVLLLLVVIVTCWRKRKQAVIFETLTFMFVLLLLSDMFMLYSTSPHEKFAMMSHVGKLLGYVYMHIMQMVFAMENNRTRKEFEAALGREKKQLRSLKKDLEFQQYALDQHSIVGITDVQGTITYVNDTFCCISGYSREELIGQNHRLLKSGEQPTEFFREMYRTIASGKVWKGEVCNRAKDGHLYWVRTTIVPLLDILGKPVQYVSMRSDMTERKRMENELVRYKENLEGLVAEQTVDIKRAKEAAEAASLAKSGFLANMSHEIRTPMNGVVGMVDILQETQLTPVQQRMVNTIRTSSLSLLAILGDVLDFSKIEAGKLQIEVIPVNLRELVEGVAQLMAPTVAEKDLDLFVFVSPDLPDWIRTDPGRLRQILFNLLGNAVKFTHTEAMRRGEVILRVEKKSLSGVDCVQCRVIDNGIGMTPETVAQLFQPFVQADATTTRRFGGTGLGLSISKHLVEMLQGQIKVHSISGTGTEFSIELPLEVAPASYAPAVTKELAGLNILVVANHPVHVEILDIYLRATGAHVKVVASQEAALVAIGQLSGQDWEVLLDLTHQSAADITIINSIRNAAPALPVVQMVARRQSSSMSGEYIVSANPVLFDDLIHTLAIASKRFAVSEVVHKTEHRSRSRTVTPTVGEAEANNQLILVAEDNQTSREVIQEQLNILGYASEAAEDGQRALTMWRSGRYSLLLTDCHMPNLDGFALTAAIRKEEPEGKRLRIIAVTGNAMQGEAQRCLLSGMDDYLSKPLRLKDLGVKLSKWLPLGQAGAVPVPHSTEKSGMVSAEVAAAPVETVWDAATLTTMVGDDPGMHRRILDKFLQGTEEQINLIRVAVAAADMKTAAELAHKVKSAARTVGALRLGELCQKLETSGRAGDVRTAGSIAAELESAYRDASGLIRGSHDNIGTA